MTAAPELREDLAAAPGLAARVTEMLAGVLAGPGRPAVSPAPEESLSRCGLDSLKAARLALQLECELGIQVPMDWLAGGSTAGGLVDRVVELASPDAPRAVAGPAVPATGPAGSDEPFPLTPIQQSYLVAKQMSEDGDQVGCHLYRELEIPGLDPHRLRAGWQRLVCHHEMLRAEFTPDGRQQIMDRARPWTMPVHDLRASGPDELAAHLEAVRRRLSHRVYLPGEWPLFGIEVTRGPRGCGIVHFSIDALITDGQGLNILLDQWCRCYADPGCALPGGGLSVRDCVLALAARRGTPAHRADLEYWRERLRDLPPGIRCQAAPAGARRPLEGRLPRREWGRLVDLARSWEVSPTALVLTAFTESVADRPFSLIITTSDRVRLPAASDGLVGPFTSSLVFAAPSAAGLSWREACQQTHQRLWQDLDHAGVSGIEARRALRQGTAAPQAVFTSMLDLAVPVTGFGRRVSYAVSQTSGVALDHQMWEQDGELRFRWDVATALFPGGAAEAAFAGFGNALLALAAAAEPGAETRPLNELQQAYFVSRAAALPDDWDGCQLYQSFHLADIDLGRLESAWLSLVSRHEVLRTEIGLDGQAVVRRQPPGRWHIPVLDIRGDRTAALHRIRDDMTRRAFRLARGPHAELRVSRDAAGCTLHLAVDLIVADALSIELMFRELLAGYAGAAPAGQLPPQAGPEGDPVPSEASRRATAGTADGQDRDGRPAPVPARGDRDRLGALRRLDPRPGAVTRRGSARGLRRDAGPAVQRRFHDHRGAVGRRAAPGPARRADHAQLARLPPGPGHAPVRRAGLRRPAGRRRARW
jgi:acyl carrier protein